MAAQQCRESERLHGIICCYIGFAFFSPCKFQTGNPSRRCALQGGFWANLAACYHAFLARSPEYPGFWRCFPKSGTAEDAIQLSREEVYLLSITMDSVVAWEWEGKNKNIFVVSKADADFRKCLLLNELDYKALTRLHKVYGSLYVLMLRTKNNIVTVNHDFDFTFFGFFNQALKTAVHTVAHVNVADAVLAFGFAHMESTVAGRRELVSDVDNTVLHIQVVNGKADELADAQPGAKQNVV